MPKKSKANRKKSVPLPLRGAIFSLAYDPFFGGAEVAVKEISARLPHIFFICFTNRFDRKWLSKEDIGGMTVVRVGGGASDGRYYGHPFQKILYVWRAWRAAEAEYKKEKFDFIWAIMASYGGIAALMFKMRHPRVPMLLTLQEGDSEEHIIKRVGIFYPWWKKIFARADYIQTISSYLKDFAERHGARTRTPIEVVPNGVSIEKIEKVIRENKKLKKQKTKKIEKVFVIISTSRLVHKNGLDTLIYAVAELKKHHAPAFLVRLVGDGPEAARLYRLAKQLKVLEEIDFVGGVSPDEVPAYLAEADLFVRPSRSEGLGNSFLEAMAAGLPVIGTPVGGIPDFLHDPHIFGITHANGLFTVPNHPADLAAKIMLVMKNKTMRANMSKNGKALVKKSYAWDGIAKRIGEIFQDIIQNAKIKVQNDR